MHLLMCFARFPVNLHALVVASLMHLRMSHVFRYLIYMEDLLSSIVLYISNTIHFISLKYIYIYIYIYIYLYYSVHKI